MKYTATVENASIGFGKNGMSVTGDIVKSNSEGGNSVNVDNTTSISTGTQYKGVAQAAMGKTEDFEKMMTRLADMKQAVLNGDMSAKEFQAEVRNFSGAYAQEIGNFLSKQEKENYTIVGNVGVKAGGDANWKSSTSIPGMIAEKATGVSVGVSGGISIDVGANMNNSTQDTQNLIAKEMYDTIMSSGNSADMINNASNLANKHINTNLNDFENLTDRVGKLTEQGTQMAKDGFNSMKEGASNMVKKVF